VLLYSFSPCLQQTQFVANEKIPPYECSNIYITQEDKQFLDKNEVPIQKVNAKSYFENKRRMKKVQARPFNNQPHSIQDESGQLKWVQKTPQSPTPCSQLLS
jgi:hypothetical protein